MGRLLNSPIGTAYAAQPVRPNRESFIGIDWTSKQAVGLAAWFPLWGQGAGRETEVVNGYTGFTFGSAPLPQFDRTYGWVGQGGGNDSGTGTNRAIRFATKPEFDAGAIVPTPWAYSFWVKTFTSNHPALDGSLMSHCNPTAPFCGTFVSIDNSGGIACNSSGTTLTDAGFKSTFVIFDAKWHHCLFVQVPSGHANTYDSNAWYYIDGKLDAGPSLTCQPGPTTSDLFFLGDDQSDPPLMASICDFRIYVGLKGLSFAQLLYNQETRWDLYARPALYIPGRASPGGASVVVPQRMTMGVGL